MNSLISIRQSEFAFIWNNYSIELCDSIEIWSAIDWIDELSDSIDTVIWVIGNEDTYRYNVRNHDPAQKIHS